MAVTQKFNAFWQDNPATPHTRNRLLSALIVSGMALISCGGDPAPGPIAAFSGVDSFGSAVGADGFGGGASASSGDSGADGSAGEGRPLANATISLTDLAGRTVTARTDSIGYYRAKVTGFVAPIVASATLGSKTYYSLTTTSPRANGFITINITGLTDMIASAVAVAAGRAGASDITPGIISANPAAVTTAIAAQRQALSTELVAKGLDPATFDPLALPFRPDQRGTGYDGVLDTTLVTRTGSGATQITPVGQVPAPGLDTSGIATLVNEFNRQAVTQAGRQPAAFADLIDDNYRDAAETKTTLLGNLRANTGPISILSPAFSACVVSTAICQFRGILISGTGPVSTSFSGQVKLTAGVWRLYGNQSTSSGGFNPSQVLPTPAPAPTPTGPFGAATANTVAAVTAARVAAVSGTSFNFPSGIPALNPSGATSLTMTDAAVDTFSVTSAAGSYSGVVSYGSCIFSVTTSSVASVPVGTVFTASPCNLSAATGGQVANGAAFSIPVTLVLGAVTSNAVALPVTVTPTGQVSVNGVLIGTVPVITPTGS